MMNATRLYTQVQSQTASPERRMVLLVQAAVRHMRVGISALEAGNPDAARQPLDRASEIVLTLQGTLDVGRAPQLAELLVPLYEYVALNLLRATTSRSAAPAKDALQAFEPIAEAFERAVASL